MSLVFAPGKPSCDGFANLFPTLCLSFSLSVFQLFGIVSGVVLGLFGQCFVQDCSHNGKKMDSIISYRTIHFSQPTTVEKALLAVLVLNRDFPLSLLSFQGVRSIQ